MRFAPLQRFPARSSSMMDGLASPDRLRPQVFSTSRRFFNPPRACRPCFMPDPLLGLRPSELYSHRVAVRRLQRRSPRGVGPRSFPSLRPAPAHAREDRSLLGPGRPLPLPTLAEALAVRSRCRPSRRRRNAAEPNGRPTLWSRSSFVPDSGSTLRGRNPIEPNVRPNPTAPKRRRTERPLDPPEPKPRRTRRPALSPLLRRAARFGHRSAPRIPEGIRRPDRSLAYPEPEGSSRFERSHSLPVGAEAPPEIRRPQPSARETEAPFTPDEPFDPPEPEGSFVSAGPAFHVATRRPFRFRRAPRLTPPATEVTV
jgi:hypothetical protein